MQILHALPRRGHGAGFSLIELMVGIAIGMVAVVVVMQVMVSSEGSRRSGTSTDDAQTAGAIALTELQRHIRQSGQGFSSELRQSKPYSRLLGCNVRLPSGSVLNGLAPVTINHAQVPAGDANTDTLLVAYGSDPGSPDGDRVNAQITPTTYSVATPSGFQLNDRVIEMPQPIPALNAPCANTYTIGRVTAIAGAVVTVDNGTAANMNGGALYNLGLQPRIQAFAVRNGNLTACDFTVNDCTAAGNTGDANIWVPIASNVVSMRAQYGVDTAAAGAMDGVVDTYNQTTPTTPCGWIRASAVRLAIVVRATQYDKDFDITTQPAALGLATNWAGSGGAPIILNNGDDWNHFRYKKFETTVPLRNLTWQGHTDLC